MISLGTLAARLELEDRSAAGLASFNRNLQGASEQVNKAAGNVTTFGGALSKTSVLLASFGAAFTVGALVSFGKELLGDADALMKLHDRTGLTIGGLQRFQVAGDDAGNTIEELSGAVTRLQDNVAGGNASAVAALGKLGLSLEDIRKLSPENEFVAISDAIRQIKNPADQVNIAMDLFGRQGAAVLPTLKRGFDDLKDHTVGMSEETVRALDTAGDALTRWSRVAKGAAAVALVEFGFTVVDMFHGVSHEAGNLRREMEAIAAQTTRLIDAIPRAPLTVAAPLEVSSTEKNAAELARAGREIDAELRDVRKSTEEASKAFETLRDQFSGAGLLKGARDYEAVLKAIGGASHLTAEEAVDVHKVFDAVIAKYKLLGSAGAAVVKHFEALRASLFPLPPQLKILESGLGSVYNDLTKIGTHVNLTAPTLSIYTMSKSVEELQRHGYFTSAALKEMGQTIGVLPNVTASATAAFKEANDSAITLGQAIRNAAGEIVGYEDATHQWAVDLDLLSQGFSRLAQIAGDSMHGIVRDIANVVAAWDLASKAAADYRAEQAKANPNRAQQAADVTSGVAAVWQATGSGSRASRVTGGAVTGAQVGSMFGPWGTAIGAGVGALVGWVRGAHQAEIETNKVRQAFVDAAGGLAALNERAHAAGVTLAALLNAKNPQQYAAAVNGLTAALDHLSKLQAGAAQFGPTKDQLAVAAKDAFDVLAYMVDLQKAGQVTQEQVNAAEVAYQQALAAMGGAGGEAAKAWLKAHDAVIAGSQAATDALAALQKRRDDIAQSYADEKPEAVMGVIEAAARAQVGALDAQIALQKAKIDAAGTSIETAMDDAAASTENDFTRAGQVITDTLDEAARLAADGFRSRFGNLHLDPIRVPYYFDGPSGPGVGTAHTGALVTAAGIQKFHAGTSRVLPFPTLASMEVPAILKVGESVLTPEATNLLGADTIRALNTNPQSFRATSVVNLAEARQATARPIHLHQRVQLVLNNEVIGEVAMNEILKGGSLYGMFETAVKQVRVR